LLAAAAAADHARGSRKVARVKTLITLSVLQTIGIAALVMHAFREERPVAPEVRPSSAAQSTIGFDEQHLRAIIREELTRLPGQSGLSADAPPPVATPARSRDPIADQHRRETIAQQIDAYRSAGAITDAQMQELQADIAQLDDASRKQMMTRLMRALNSGDIKGRL
jgi:hypothetical protein